ncbi:MAG: pilus assembly PilX family protein [Marinicella sp.]
MMNSSMQKQQGAALAVGLILLVIITLMGYTGMKGTMLQEKMAAGIHNRSLASSGSNSALREGETFLYNLVRDTNGVGVEGTADGSFRSLYSYLADEDDPTSGINPTVEDFLKQNWVNSSGTAHGYDFTAVPYNGSLIRSPEYLIYELPWSSTNRGTQEFATGNGSAGGSGTKQQSFVVVGKSQSGDGLSYSIVQSLYTVVTSSSPTN